MGASTIWLGDQDGLARRLARPTAGHRCAMPSVGARCAPRFEPPSSERRQKRLHSSASRRGHGCHKTVRGAVTPRHQSNAGSVTDAVSKVRIGLPQPKRRRPQNGGVDDLAGGPGFEPGLTESESVVLPLDDPPITGFADRYQRFENCVARRALRRPTFLRSTSRASRVT